ncbi:MAG: response regulator [Elusimicrobiota bacterium]|nr:response regulator [Elusimicrobiota bacterium]
MLVVDDSRAMLDIMEHLLGFFGGSVHTAATEEMAMAIADKHEFDLVISDHFLQETTGIELLAKLRRKRPLLKAILMSGAFDPSEKEIKKHKLGAFLKKPFEMHELKTAIKKTLKI